MRSVVVFISNMGPAGSIFRFKGRVFPAIFKATVFVPRTTHWKVPEDGIDISYRLELMEGNLTVTANVRNYSEKLHFPMLMRAWDFARAAVDTLAFATGAGLTVFFETVTLPNGTIEQLATEEKELAALSTAVEQETCGFSDIMDMMLLELPISRAMHDLIQSITVLHAAQTSCARAIETIRNYMSPDTEDRKKQWRLMGDTLRFEYSYSEPLRNLSFGPRHGDPIYFPGPEVKEARKRAWTIMNRYLEFRRLGGKDPLPLDRFPVLA